MAKMTKDQLIQARKELVNEIKDTFYIKFSHDNEDGDEETTQMLSELIEMKLQRLMDSVNKGINY